MAEIKLRVPALEKLVEYTASGIGNVAGSLLAPWKAKRQGKALEIEAEHRAGAMVTIAKAQQEARAILENPDSMYGAEFSISESIEQVVNFQQERRLRNIGSVIHRASDLLSEVEEVPDHEPDHDWTARFFNEVQDVSSEQMQELWARVLAGQVERPESTSIKTLDILKNINQKVANLFENLCSMSISIFDYAGRPLDIRVSSLDGSFSANSLVKLGLPFNDLNRLNEHGLVVPTYDTRLRSFVEIRDGVGTSATFKYQGEDWILRTISDHTRTDDFNLAGVALSGAGMELSQSVNILPIPEYDKALKAYFNSQSLEMVRLTI